MSDKFRGLFTISVGLLRTHHVFVSLDGFYMDCSKVPIDLFLEGYSLQSKITKRGNSYWYECIDPNANTPEMPLKVLAKAAWFQSKGDWDHRKVNPVFKKTLWQDLDKYILEEQNYATASAEKRMNSDFHLIEFIAQINLQVRQFDIFKKNTKFDKKEDTVLKLLHIWYRTLQKQAVNHLISHNMDIKDSAVASRINGLMNKHKNS
jgi:hypothetical protein